MAKFTLDNCTPIQNWFLDMQNKVKNDISLKDVFEGYRNQELKNYLKSGSKVFLDDADRKGESIIGEKWEQIYKLKKANTITSSRHRQWIFN